jgi:proteasome lid subunit RPN8/RPN11
LPSVMRIQRDVLSQMLAHARLEPELESCGLLAGREGITTHIFPASNVFRSSTRFEIAPEDLFRIFRHMRSENLALTGIYHSHPKIENVPSPADIEQFSYPQAACVILRPQCDDPSAVRAFRITGGKFTELQIEPVA